jgi:hypothetical protein
LYDLVKSNGLLKIVIENIPAEEYKEIVNGINDSINAIYSY